MTFRPMLAVDYGKLKALRFPVIAMPKIDGIRCIIKDGKAYSRSLKPIRNVAASARISKIELEGLDGELIVGPATAPDAYRQTVSGVMTLLGDWKPTFYVFDSHLQPKTPYITRLETVVQQATYSSSVVPLHFEVVKNLDDLLAFEVKMLAEGYEGIITRCPMGAYKYGRSTPAEQGLVKKKAFLDSDAVIVGAVELQHNHNEVQVNALGLTERSTHQNNKAGAGTLGALIVRDLKTLVEFNVGTGFIAREREELWDAHRKAQLIGRIIKYKYFPVGVKDAPRHPVFMGFRDKDDL